MTNDLLRRRLISIGLSIVAIGVTWLGSITSQVLTWVGIGILAVSVIISWTIRCPNCNRGLSGKRQVLLPRYCPHCGHKIWGSEFEE